MSKMSRWFRHYAGMMRDEKLVSAAVKAKQPVERVIWVWGAILESAAEEQNDGRYTLDPDEAAYFLRCSGDDVSAILVALEALGRLHQGAVVRWNDRQYISDSSGERVRKHRQKRAETDVPQRSDVTADSCNTEVTTEDRYSNENETDVPQRSDVTADSCNTEVTTEDRYSNENETDVPQRSDVTADSCNTEVTTEDRYSNENETPASVYVSVYVSDSVSPSTALTEKITDEFEIWYAVFPKHVGRGAALRAYRTARKKADAETLLAAAHGAAAQYAQADPKFVPHGATWLNGERWLDQTAPQKKRDWRDQPEYSGVR